MEDKSIKIDDHVNKSFNDVVADITEFVECAQRCILPHNTLLFNVIMNALEMMIMRSELEGRETEFEGIVTTRNNEESPNNLVKEFDMSNISEITQAEVDAVIEDIMGCVKD
jgi:hypothetical protein